MKCLKRVSAMLTNSSERNLSLNYKKQLTKFRKNSDSRIRSADLPHASPECYHCAILTLDEMETYSRQSYIARHVGISLEAVFFYDVKK